MELEDEEEDPYDLPTPIAIWKSEIAHMHFEAQ